MSAEDWAEEATRVRDEQRGAKFMRYLDDHDDDRNPEVRPTDALYVGIYAGGYKEQELSKSYAAGKYKYDPLLERRSIGRALREHPDLLGDDPSDELKELLK